MISTTLRGSSARYQSLLSHRHHRHLGSKISFALDLDISAHAHLLRFNLSTLSSRVVVPILPWLGRKIEILMD